MAKKFYVTKIWQSMARMMVTHNHGMCSVDIWKLRWNLFFTALMNNWMHLNNSYLTECIMWQPLNYRNIERIIENL